MTIVRSVRLSLTAILTLILALTFSCKTSSQNQANLSSEALELADGKMKAYVDKGKLPCMSLLVIKNGEKVHQSTFGYANIEEERPLNEETILRIYSMSKPITAAALMILYDEGKFQLDDPVANYIPEFKNTTVWEDGKEVAQEENFTIRHLLTHTAGFCYGWGESHVDSLYNLGYQGGIWATKSLADMIKVVSTFPLKNQPGSRWEYSISLDVAGYLVEVLSGKSLDEFMQTRIFDPLEMKDTGFEVPEQDYDRVAMIYSEGKKKGKLTPVTGLTKGVLKKVTLFSGGGGLVSTIGDYGLFVQMLLNGGELNGVRVLKESTVKLIMSDQMPAGTPLWDGFGHGLGGIVNTETGEYSWSGMAATYFVVDPENNMVVLSFTQYVPNTEYKFAEKYQKMVGEALLLK